MKKKRKNIIYYLRVLLFYSFTSWFSSSFSAASLLSSNIPFTISAHSSLPPNSSTSSSASTNDNKSAAATISNNAPSATTSSNDRFNNPATARVKEMITRANSVPMEFYHTEFLEYSKETYEKKMENKAWWNYY